MRNDRIVIAAAAFWASLYFSVNQVHQLCLSTDRTQLSLASPARQVRRRRPSTTSLGCKAEVSRGDVGRLLQASEDLFGFSFNGTRYALSRDSLTRSRSNVGHVGRLRRLLCKLSSGHPIHGAVIGGSITNGNGIADGVPRYGEHFENFLGAAFPPLPRHNRTHKIETIAYEASWSCTVLPHMQATFKNKDRGNIDLVVLEFAVNDHMVQYKSGFATQARDEIWQVVQCTEAMVRFFLSLNPHICIVMLHMTQAWGEGLAGTAHRYPKASHLHGIISDAYSIPTVDVGKALRNGPENWNCLPRQAFPEEWARHIHWQRWEIGPGHHLYKELIPKNNQTCFLGFWATDWSHPSPLGHKLTSDVLAHLLLSELSFPRSLEEIPKDEHGPWNPMQYGPLTITDAEMVTMTNVVYRAEAWVKGSLQTSVNLKEISLWTQNYDNSTWEYGLDKGTKCWQCTNCTSVIAFRVDLRENKNGNYYHGRASLSLEYKRSFKFHGDFVVFATHEQPLPMHLPPRRQNKKCQYYDSRQECPILPSSVVQRTIVSGYWEQMNTQWAKSRDVLEWTVNEEPKKSTVFLVVVPVAPKSSSAVSYIKIKGITVHGVAD